MGSSQSTPPKEDSIEFSSILQQSEKRNLDDLFADAIHNTLYSDRVRSSKSIEELKIEQQQQLKLLKNCKLQTHVHEKKKHQGGQHILAGILFKQSSNILSPWQKRYCQASQNCFMYKQLEAQNSATAGYLNFNLLAAKLAMNKVQNPDFFQIQIEGCEKKFVFRGADAKQTKKWAQKLKKTIDKSLGQQYKLTYLSHYHRFWRKQYFSQKQFRQMAQIGDIMLFRGNKNSSVIQRAITFEEYDHIAVILKNAYEQILLFQANSGTGVGIMTWRSFIKHEHFKMQDLVVFRKLNIQRDKTFFRIVQEFVGQNIGKKYNFSVTKMLGNRSSDNGNQNNREFFCSSLVASLYKKLGILEQGISSNKYMPSNFSSDYGLKLKCNGYFGNAYLEPQKIIVFEQNFFQKE